MAFQCWVIKLHSLNMVQHKTRTVCLYKKALRSICVPNVVVEKQHVWALNIVSVCLYTWLSYMAWKSQIFCIVLYCHLWPVWLYHTFHIISLKERFSEKNLLNIKCGFLLPLQFWSRTFLVLKRTQWGIINLHTSSCTVPIILARF